MAKRVRSRSTHRPGGQGPSRTKKTSEAGASTADDVTVASADGPVTDVDYSEVEVDEEAVAALAASPATPEAQPAARSPRRARRSGRKQRSSDLAARAAAEDVWVRGDLRRIGLVSLVLLVALAASWVVFGFFDVLNLY